MLVSPQKAAIVSWFSSIVELFASPDAAEVCEATFRIADIRPERRQDADQASRRAEGRTYEEDRSTIPLFAVLAT